MSRLAMSMSNGRHVTHTWTGDHSIWNDSASSLLVQVIHSLGPFGSFRASGNASKTASIHSLMGRLTSPGIDSSSASEE